MSVIDTGIENRNDNLRAALCLRPGPKRIEMSVRLSAILSGIVQRPLLRELGVIRGSRKVGRFDRSRSRVPIYRIVQADLIIRLGVQNSVRGLLILTRDLQRIGVIQIVDRY